MTKRELLVASRLHLAILALTGLWIYLLVGQIVAPGFTDYWGYLMVQIPVVLVVVLALSRWLAASGGLSWPCHLIVVAAVYADTIGNAAGLYRRFDVYDKIIHVIGPAAIAAVSYDIYTNRLRRETGPGSVPSRPPPRRWAAPSSGSSTSSGRTSVFLTYRYAGRLDTTYDLLFGALGSFAVAALLWWREMTPRRAPHRR